MIEHNLAAIEERIRAAAIESRRDPDEIRLIAVSKTVPAERVREAVQAGAHILGENYIQEAREKVEALKETPASWHFIGHLQTNKAKYVVRFADLIHSVDRIKLAAELDKQAHKLGKVQPILIQVNVSGETTKSGTAPEDLRELLQEASQLPNISIQGLMTLPPFFDDPKGARPYFRRLAELRDEMAALNIENISVKELSMGMTGDFEAAIAEGATMVRIGTAIFGARA